MSDTILSIHNVSKQYQLGTFGTGTIGRDVDRWFRTKVMGKEDPYLKIGQTNDRTSKEKADFVWALRDINFEVKRGEVLGIIGKNGAGKSTLLKLLSRVTSPTTGAIRSAGRMASLLEVGTGFHPELTGLENIYLNGAILGMTKAEIKRKLDEIIDFSGCALYIDTPVKRYSSGMTVRLGFAVAAFLDPEILVVDEVLAVGDAEFQKKAIGKMKDVSQGQGRTVLFVSHNMASIQQLCSRCILLKNGEIKSIGDTKSLIDEYLEENYAVQNINLIERMDRKGSGSVKFSRISVLNENDEESSVFLSGRKISFRIYYTLSKKKEFRNCRISLTVDKDAMTYLLFSSELVNSNEIVLNQDGFFQFSIDRLPLSNGVFTLNNLFLESNNEILDWVDNVGKIHIEDGNYYGQGKDYPSGWAGKGVMTDFIFNHE